MTHGNIGVYADNGAPFSPAKILSNKITICDDAVISTDHSQSCHGLPVLVMPSGQAMSPEEVVARGWDTGCGVCHWGESPADEHALCDQWRHMMHDARQRAAVSVMETANSRWDMEAQRLYDETEKASADYFRVQTAKRKLARIIEEADGCDEPTAQDTAAHACGQIRHDEFEGV